MAKLLPQGAKLPFAVNPRPLRNSGLLPNGFVSPPAASTAPSAYDVAWLAVLPTAAPALTADELARVRFIRSGAVESRVRDRAQAVLSANGTP